jgi:hypothetical protein
MAYQAVAAENAAASVSADLAASVTPPPPPMTTFTAKATSTEECTVSWTGVSPTELARNGTDANGYGPYTTGPLTGEPTSGSYAFEAIVPGDTYIYTLTYGTGQTLTVTFTQPVVVTPPPTTKPVWGGYHANNQASPVPQGEVLDYADNNATTYTVTSARAAQFAGKRAMVKIGNCTSAQATAIAEVLVAAGLANADIPIMWEGNQDVSGWEPNWDEKVDTASQFIALFLEIVAAMDAVPGAKFRYWWCPNLNQQGNQATGRTQLDTWPGVGPNKNIGIAPDGYDNSGDTTDSAGIIAQLAPFEALAKSAGAVFGGLCETGLNNGSGSTADDDPDFWNALLPHAEANGWLFVVNFAVATGASFNSDNGPNSIAAIQAFYGTTPPPPPGTAGFGQPVMAAPAGPHLKGTYTKTLGTGPGQMFWNDTFQEGELNQSYWRNTWGDAVEWGNDPGYTSGTATVAPASAGGGLTCDGTASGSSSCVVTCEPLTTPLVTFPEGGWYIQIRFKLSAVDTFFPAFWFPRGGEVNSGVELGCELDWFEGGNIPENTLNNSQSHSDYNGDQQSEWGPFRTADHQWPFNFGGATSGTDSVDFAIMGMEFRPAERILNYYAQSSPSMDYPDVLIAEGDNFPTGNPTNTAITSTFANLATPTGSGTVGAPNYVFGITPQGKGKMYIAEVQAYMLPS